MFKKILVATDASEYSRHALSTAIEIAKLSHAEIVLLHVIYPPQGYYYTGLNVSTIQPISEERINEIGQQVMDTTIEGIDISQVTFSTKTITGYPAAAVLDEIEKNNIDLVVMGSRGHGPMAGALTGSVTLRVLANASCPVLVVR